jgi:hypothetical protein
MKFLYYLAAIGEPNIDIKIKNLRENLEYIYDNIKINFDIIINCYEEDLDLVKFISDLCFLDNIYIHNKKGVLCELWFTNKHNENVKNYDYILFMLDDVKILNLNLNLLIDIKHKYNIEFLSPKVLRATWDYMKNSKYNNLILTNRVEIFCLLLNPVDFNKFISLNDINNCNIWGVDYIMSHFNIRTAVYHNNVVDHILKSNSNHNKAIEQMTIFLNKYGYTSDTDIKTKYNNEIIEIIYI